MKAIVAKVLFGGILGWLNCTNSTIANPVNPSANRANRSIVSAFSSQHKFSVIPQLYNALGSASSVNINDSYAFNRKYHQWLSSVAIDLNLPQSNRSLETFVEKDCSLFCDREAYPNNRPQIEADLSSQKPYVHRSQSANIVLGFQNTFWSSKKPQYWGVTTVEHWGSSQQQSNPPQLNYINSAPILATGNSSLTFSGGGNNSLVTGNTLDRNRNSTQEFKDFRGGITYHHGVTRHLTMGVGFVYEDIFASFTQLTYKSNILPITTTVSLVAKESDTDLHSHLRFQPNKNFLVNYYHDGEEQKFDADLAIYPGLNLIARGNSRKKDYSAGIKVAIATNYFSLTATAALDREQNLQWKLNSQIGRFKFAHSSNKNKTDSELSTKLVDSTSLGVRCSSFIKYQTSQVKQEQEDFIVWGGKFNSPTKVSQNRHQWDFDLGYGISSHGKGWIANSSIALKPDLFLKLNYQETSAISDETKIKLQLSSN